MKTVIAVGMSVLWLGVALAYPPEQTEIVLKAGMNLDDVARQTYGNKCYSDLLKIHNGIEDVRRIPAGTVISTPTFPVLFEQAGMEVRYASAIVHLASAVAEYHGLMKKYEPIRRVAGGNFESVQLSLEPGMVYGFRRISDNIREASRIISASLAEGHQLPKSALGQLESARKQSRELAFGRTDGYAYDVDMVDQRFGLALKYLLVWVKEGYR